MAQRGILAKNSKAFVLHAFAPDENLFYDTVINKNLTILFNLYFQHRCRILNNFPLGFFSEFEISAGVGPKMLIWVSVHGEQACQLLRNHLLFRHFQLILCHHNCLEIIVSDRFHLNFFIDELLVGELGGGWVGLDLHALNFYLIYDVFRLVGLVNFG